jgi:single-stranded-DNA-specific exonuclease
VGFTLAPRINAAGRLGRTETALKLLSSKSREEAREWAQTLCALNRRRQELETAVWEDAVSALSGSTPESPIVLRSESWHSGVVGIAAARLAETYGLPAVMICVDGDRGKGSCRSFGDFNLFEALSACSGYLESFGGHALAAGLTIRRENINGFRQALAEYYRRNPPSEKGALAPELLITDPAVLSMAGVESLAALEPCGCGNESPLLCMTDVLLESVIPIGGGRHLRLKVSKQGARFDCVFFSHSAQALGLEAGETADICFTPQINTFRSYRSVQLLTAGLRPAAGCHSLAF